MSGCLPSQKSIAIVGGTGRMGFELAYRWAVASYRVIIGSRSPEKARLCSQELTSKLSSGIHIESGDYITAVRRSDIVVASVPYSSHNSILESLYDSLQGKLLIDITVPLSLSARHKVLIPPPGSAALEAQQILGPGVEICTAFQNISIGNLKKTGFTDCEVLVTGTSREARTITLQLVADAGFKGWDAGPIENSSVVEGLTSILIHINKQYKSNSAGIKITGV